MQRIIRAVPNNNIIIIMKTYYSISLVSLKIFNI